MTRYLYVDCYGQQNPNKVHPDMAQINRDFPRNSYGPHTLEECLSITQNVLGNQTSGILEVRISQVSMGMSPIQDRNVFRVDPATR